MIKIDAPYVLDGPSRAEERTIDALWNRIGTILDTISSRECYAFVEHIGHGQPKTNMA